MENADGKETLKRRLYFSDAETSKHPTPSGDSNKSNSANNKTLNFVPPMLKEGILTVIRGRGYFSTNQVMEKIFNVIYNWR